MGSPPVFIWSFTNCNKRAPRQCSGHCIWSYLKNILVNKWLHQPPQIRSNKTGYIYSAAELRAICGSLLTDYLHGDPNALEMGIVLSLGIPQCFPPPRFLQWKEKSDSVVSQEDWSPGLQWLVGRYSRGWELQGSLFGNGVTRESDVLGWNRLYSNSESNNLIFDSFVEQ